ncbi:hypothetical protein N656DRAFT_783091 [Canariomyces notabilis]|uniref:ABM domain-containing protein n=1 Tax=Canariomyces notabilis TaxID=2074819 RepID=A0AAN6T9P8_9PEZI|nr:hypothetical protein N656DRAFT_783091 [Canariomyces arenarius]
MTVTEFATLHFTSAPSLNEVRGALSSAIRAQDSWHAANFPDLPSSISDRAVALFEQIDDPTQILITTKWDSVEAHLQWIRSEQNTKIMTGLAAHIIPKDTVLFHVNGIIFGDSAGTSVPLLQAPVISVSRFFIPREERGSFEAKFGEVKGVLDKYVSPGSLRFGWREDLEEGAKEEEFVVVCGWETVESHSEFTNAAGFSQFQEIEQFIAQVDRKHYRRFSL